MAVPTHYLAKRDLLYHPRSSPAALSAVGREFLSQEAFSDALDFFERAQDRDGIAHIKRLALERGDTFLLARLERFDRLSVAEADWKEAARVARAQGMESMAAFAERKIAPPAPAASPAAPGVQPLEEAGESPLKAT